MSALFELTLSQAAGVPAARYREVHKCTHARVGNSVLLTL